MSEFSEHFRGHWLYIQRVARRAKKAAAKPEKELSNLEKHKAGLTHRVDPSVEIEYSDMFKTTEKVDSPDFGVLETVIPLLFALAFPTYIDHLLGSVFAAVILYSKFYDWIPDYLRIMAVIGLCITYYLSGYTDAACILLMTYAPFHTLLETYSKSFNFAELF